MHGLDNALSTERDRPNDDNLPHDLFALTDEQILGIEPESAEPAAAEQAASAAPEPSADTASDKPAATAPPQWLAERMNDPWHGDEAARFWEASQRAEKEAAAYRDVFATPDDARTLKELYPGGIADAKSAAERARELGSIDDAYFRGDASARLQLAQRLMQQDPAAFREMVEIGVRELQKAQSNAPQNAGAENSPASAAQTPAEAASAAPTPPAAPAAHLDAGVARDYAAFERAANADLERSVGAAISQALDRAMPNLRHAQASRPDSEGSTSSLQDRLGAEVRSAIDAALKSDAQLGEQVARLLGGRRFDDASRSQVVRLIDARAQQLVPGAVRRVISGWTQTVLAAKNAPPASDNASVAAASRNATAVSAPPTTQPSRQDALRRAAALASSAKPRRFDYGRLSDEQILDL